LWGLGTPEKLLNLQNISCNIKKTHGAQVLFEWVKSSRHYSHRHAWREVKSPCHEPKGVRKARM